MHACSVFALSVVSCHRPINPNTSSGDSTPPPITVLPPAAANNSGRDGDYAEIADELKQLRLRVARIDADMSLLPENEKMTPFDLGAMEARREMVEQQIHDLTEERRKLRLLDAELHAGAESTTQLERRIRIIHP